MGFAIGFYLFAALFLWASTKFSDAPLIFVVFWKTGFLSAAIAEIITGTLYLTASLFRTNHGWWFKDVAGRTRTLPLVMNWPYIFFERRAWRRYRMKTPEPVFEQVREGLFQGARPIPEDVSALRAAGVNAVLDLVAEFQAPEAIRASDEFAYLSIPLLDGTAPTLAELDKGAEFVSAAIAAGRTVLVHCTFGHGRSSTFSAAALLRMGAAETPKQALEILRRLNRKIWLTREQKRLLEEFAGRMKR